MYIYRDIHIYIYLFYFYVNVIHYEAAAKHGRPLIRDCSTTQGHILELN
jgi:hypothetical protein